VKLRGYRVELGEIEATLKEHPGIREAVVVATGEAESRRLAAYLVAEPATAVGSDAEVLEAQVKEWEGVWDQAYREPPAPNSDPAFNVMGWVSSFTGRAMPAEDMREWVDRSCDWVRASAPGRVLDVGVGTGLLLFRLARECDDYCGVDFSEAALAYLRRQRLPPSVRLLRATADALEAAGDGFDAVVFNSVVQYFPNLAYLRRALVSAAGRLAPGGRILVGDVRSLPLVGAFHAALELERATPTLSSEALQARIRDRGRSERELLLDPRFFFALRRELPITRIDVTPKRGHHRNEMTGFRYDVVLELGAEQAPRFHGPWVLWTSEADLRARLESNAEVVALAGIPNVRVAPAIRALDGLTSTTTTGELRAAIAAADSESLDPESLFEVAAEHGYQLRLTWAGHGPEGDFAAYFWRRGDCPELHPPGLEDEVQDWSAYGNDPVAARLARRLVPELQALVQRRLPEYMLPAHYVQLERLPLTPNGKVDRRALPAPERSRPDVDSRYRAPGSPLEEKLGAIWSQVLGIEGIGVEDDFFKLGGHSLMATQVVARCRDAFGIEVPLAALFQAPTIAALASLLEASPAAPAASIPRRPQRARAPLSLAQQRLWFLDRLRPGSSAYHMLTGIDWPGEVDAVRLERALNQVVRRHEVLRTAFDRDRPEQVILPSRRVGLDVVDLCPLGDRQRRAELRRLRDRMRGQPFDLAQPPLLRACLVRLRRGHSRLLVAMHHIVSDAWSLQVLKRELQVLYAADSGDAGLAELPFQYADFAVWQREQLDGDAIREHVEYWRRTLAGAPELTGLPTDRPRTALAGSRGEARHFLVPDQVVGPLGQLAREEGATEFMALLAAFQALLHRLSGQEDVVVGSVSAGRDRTELEQLIGFFVNTIVFRTDLGGRPSFREVLRRVRDVTTEAYAHQDVPFERLVEELAPGRGLSHNPIFQVMFALQNAYGQDAQAPGAAPAAEVEPRIPKFDLSLYLTPAGGALTGLAEYSTDLFERETVAALLERYVRLLEAVGKEPDRPLAELSLLLPGELE
ncbi:MAG TPA: condensation domain-containing protein, partial [Candidatus Dormibacteraeota bacterium]